MADIATLSGRKSLSTDIRGYAPATGDLKALIEAKREGYLWRNDLTAERITAIRRQLAAAEAANIPPPFEGIKTWLARLAAMVTNTPAPSGEACAIFAEVCSDIPDGAWTSTTRLAWVRQPDRNGYPIGARWPAPAELRNVLLPFAQQIRDEIATLRAMLAIAEKPPERSGRVVPDDQAKQVVRQMLQSWRSELQTEDEA